eukprot:7378244-Prymnesium_polylepis.2
MPRCGGRSQCVSHRAATRPESVWRDQKQQLMSVAARRRRISGRRSRGGAIALYNSTASKRRPIGPVRCRP